MKKVSWRHLKILKIFSVLSIIFILRQYYNLSKQRIREKAKVDTILVLKNSILCKNKAFKFKIEQHGDFWMFKNFIRAEHGELNCYANITYTTHGDLTYLSHLIPLVERWRAPISIALETPGTDFRLTLNSIFYLRNCQPAYEVIRQYVTFHLFFDYRKPPWKINKDVKNLEKWYRCPVDPPYFNVTSNDLYRKKHKLNYNINVARNLAKKCALTYFVLPCDIELYPSLNLVPKFLDMIANNLSLIQTGNNIFFLPVFEIKSEKKIPDDKKKLQKLFDLEEARFFHLNACHNCHNFPKKYEWLGNTKEEEMKIYTGVKRLNEYYHWEPFFIATQNDPILFDERLTWEAKYDKMTMTHILCSLDYNFLGLSNAFLVHLSGTSIHNVTKSNLIYSEELIRKVIFPEIKQFFPGRNECRIFSVPRVFTED